MYKYLVALILMLGLASTSIAKDFYIDPMNGTTLGDGSKEKPWRQFSEVMNAKKIDGSTTLKGVVHAGDTIYLLDGLHDVINIPAWPQTLNTDYITVTGKLGHKPIVASITGGACKKWIFKNLVITNYLNKPYNAVTNLIRIRGAVVEDVMITDNLVYCNQNVDGWTNQDWLTKGYNGIFLTGDRITISRNVIKNTANALMTGGTKILIEDNYIDRFIYDGISGGGDGCVIRGNVITNHNRFLEDPYHTDGIQLWADYQFLTRVNTNILIEKNIILASTGVYADVPNTGGKIQGITIFDGYWDNVVVRNNIVDSPAFHGISLYGCDNSKIHNNLLINTQNALEKTWIGVFPRKGLTIGPTTEVYNNISQGFAFQTNTVQHDNICSILTNKTFTTFPGNKVVPSLKPLFVDYDNLNLIMVDKTMIQGPEQLKSVFIDLPYNKLKVIR